MATVVPTWLKIPDTAGGDGAVVTWGPMKQGDVAQPVTELSNNVGQADRSVQVEGTFGAGGMVTFQGSNDGVNFHTLNDPSLTPLSFTAAGLRSVLEASRQVAPVVSGGDGTTSVTITLLMRKLR